MTYPHERQIEYCTSRAIEDYFDNEGYTVVVLPNSPRVEKLIPYAHLFAGEGVKIFGLQYKRLQKGANDYWEIDVPQYRQITKFHWIYYALPQVRSIKQHRNALHLLSLVEPSALRNKIESSGTTNHCTLSISDLGIGDDRVSYYRWGGFVQNLFRCRLGWKPSTPEELRTIFTDARDLLETMIDLFVIPLKPAPAFRITPFATSIENINEENFDLGFETQE